jgi:acyl dehydratase
VDAKIGPMSESRPQSLWLEVVEVGQHYRTTEHLLAADEIIEFASRYDPQPFHLSEQGAVGTLFGSLAASGWHTAAITMRLVVTSAIPIATGIIGASIELAWPTPTRPGDLLHVDLTVDSVTTSRSKPDRGFVTARYTVNQHGAVRQHTVANLLAFRRPAGRKGTRLVLGRRGVRGRRGGRR